MNQRAKLHTAIRNNPRDVRFADACRAAESIGFTLRVRGSHHTFSRSGEEFILNFQNRHGKIPPYQARQLIDMLDKYEQEIC